MTTNNSNNNNNDETMTMETSSDEQKRLESEAVAKESAAVQKASKLFSELTSKVAATEEQGGAGEELKQTVRLLVMAENTDALTAVLTRLNGDRKSWEMAQRQPVALIAMIIEEQQKRMAQLQNKLQQVTAAVGQQQQQPQ